MKNRNKKGFTIVELVIVIAIVGVLSAILIPTFINLTQRANEASDDSLVKNLNTALKMEEQKEGHKESKTLQGAIDDLIEEGYLLENLVAKSGKDLLWDQKANQFLLNRDGVEGNQYWQIVNSLPEKAQAKYSYYAGKNFSIASTANELKYGFDAGYNDNIENLSFTGAASAPSYEVAIRTNSGALTINAPYDVVHHYGDVDSLNIVAVANSSYHENGNVKFVEISKGRIVLEEKAEVKHIHVNAKVDEEGEKLNEFDEVTIAKAEEKAMPVLSRDDVEIASTGTLVVALQSGTSTTDDKDYIWLTKQGVYEQIKVSDNKESAGDVWVNTSDKSEETKEAAQQIANNIDRDDDGKVNSTVTIEEKSFAVDFDEDRNMIFVQEEPTQTAVDPVTGDKTYEKTIYTLDDSGDITVTVTTTVVDVNEEVKSETTSEPAAVEAETIVQEINSGVEENVEKPADKETEKSAAIYFDGGKGTEQEPYLISTIDGLINVDSVSKADGTFYYRLTEDIVAPETTQWAIGFLYSDPANYVIDMGGHTITIGEKHLFGYAVNLEMYNGTFNFTGTGSVVDYACYQSVSAYHINFHDLVLTGDVATGAAHYGPLVSYAFGIDSGNSTIDASNVVNNMNINNRNSTGYSGGLFGYVQGKAVSSSVTNCTFNGTIVSAYAGAFLNPCSYPNGGVVISENNTLNGQLMGSKTVIEFGCNTNLTGGQATLDALQATVTKGQSAVLTVVAASNSLISVNENNEVILNRNASADSYRVAVVFNVDKDDDGTGGYPRYITVDLEQFEGASKNTGLFKYSIHQESSDLSEGKTVVLDQNDTIIWIDTDGYHIYEPGYSVSNNKATIYAYAYAAGNIVTYQTVGYSY